MKQVKTYLLTSVENIPIIIECLTRDDVAKFDNKRAQKIGKTCAEINIKSGNWVDKVNSQMMADIINKKVCPLRCWVTKEDAQL